MRKERSGGPQDHVRSLPDQQTRVPMQHDGTRKVEWSSSMFDDKGTSIGGPGSTAQVANADETRQGYRALMRPGEVKDNLTFAELFYYIT